VPATASSSIPAIADQLAGVELPASDVLVPTLSAALQKVTDQRKARGIRHRLAVVLTVTVCAVAAGARSFVAVAEWVADLPSSVADLLGTSERCPSESTHRASPRRRRIRYRYRPVRPATLHCDHAGGAAPRAGGGRQIPARVTTHRPGR
jgi:hypothetical protein